jgi:hypothetical protein
MLPASRRGCLGGWNLDRDLGRGHGHAGQPDHGTVADRREALKAHVAAADGPLVVLLKHERAPTADINLR